MGERKFPFEGDRGFSSEILRRRSGFRQRAQTPANRLNFNVWSERKRTEKLNYMHQNPVRRGLVLEPEQWPWSSYRSYAFGEEGMVKINQWPKAVMRIRGAA
jgi:hypothetical protein